MEIKNTVNRVADDVLKACKEAHLKIVSVESCTGGLISTTLTNISGSSEVFDRGYVVYSNEAKVDMLGIDRKLLDVHGAVSDEVVVELAKLGLKKASNCDVSIAVVGVAGSSVEGKPPGLIHIASAYKDGTVLKEKLETNFRERIFNRYTATKACFDLLLRMIMLKSEDFTKADPKAPSIKSKADNCSINPNCNCTDCKCVNCQCGKDDDDDEIMMAEMSATPQAKTSSSTGFTSVASSIESSNEEIKEGPLLRPQSVPAQFATRWSTADERDVCTTANSSPGRPGENYAFYNGMDEENKQAMDILTSEGPEAAIKFMTIDPKTGKSRGSYAEMRSRFG